LRPCRRRDRIDQDLVAGLTSAEKAELTAAKRRISAFDRTLDLPTHQHGRNEDMTAKKWITSPGHS
jgi:hypothetical protein